MLSPNIASGDYGRCTAAQPQKRLMLLVRSELKPSHQHASQGQSSLNHLLDWMDPRLGNSNRLLQLNVAKFDAGDSEAKKISNIGCETAG